MSYDFFVPDEHQGDSSVIPTPPEREFSALESAFAWICVIIGFLFCQTANSLQLFSVHILMLGVSSFVLYKKGAKFGFKPIFFSILSLAFGFSTLVTVEWVSLLAILCAFVSYCAFVYTATDNAIGAPCRDLLPLNLLRALKSINIGEWGDSFRAMFSRGKKSFKALFTVVLGLFVAIVPTMIVVMLLSYDGGFVKLLENSFSFVGDFSLPAFIRSVIFGTLFGLYVFGIYCLNTQPRKEVNIDEKVRVLESARCAPMLFIGAALFPLTVVYIFFFVSQWQYYVSGFSGVLPAGVINYAEYARSGFFELCSVSGINFLILAAVALLLKREDKAGKLFLKVVSLLFSVMTLVLIGTAMAKMALYINRFGLTEKRVLSSWFMVLLAIIFVIIIFRQLSDKIKLFTCSAAACAVMVLVLVFSNYTGIIASYNVNMFISGNSDEIDTIELVNLGVSAVPAMISYAEYCEETGFGGISYQRVCAELNQYKEEFAEEDKKFSLSFSFPEHRARNALEEYYAGK